MPNGLGEKCPVCHHRFAYTWERGLCGIIFATFEVQDETNPTNQKQVKTFTVAKDVDLGLVVKQWYAQLYSNSVVKLKTYLCAENMARDVAASCLESIRDEEPDYFR